MGPQTKSLPGRAGLTSAACIQRVGSEDRQAHQRENSCGRLHHAEPPADPLRRGIGCKDSVQIRLKMNCILAIPVCWTQDNRPSVSGWLRRLRKRFRLDAYRSRPPQLVASFVCTAWQHGIAHTLAPIDRRLTARRFTLGACRDPKQNASFLAGKLPNWCHYWSMANDFHLIVHFSCPHCATIYAASQEEQSEHCSGNFHCGRCGTPVHEWTGGLYNFSVGRLGR